MKKLIVLALSAIMVLSVAAVSMAAVTVGGEVSYKYDFNGYDNVNAANKDQKVNGLDQAMGKITVKADVTDSISAFLALKADPGMGKSLANNAPTFDENWVSMKTDFADFKFGKFGMGFGGKKDIVDIYTKDLKGQFAAMADFKVAEGFDIAVDYLLDGNGATGNIDGDIVSGDGAYAVTFNYANDTFGGSVGVVNYAASEVAANWGDKLDSGMILNGFYKMDALTVFLVYDTIKLKGLNKDASNTIIGATYDSADLPVYARVEYDTNDQKDLVGETLKYNGWGLRLGYKITDAVKVEYQRKQQEVKGGADQGGESSIKLAVVF